MTATPPARENPGRSCAYATCRFRPSNRRSARMRSTIRAPEPRLRRSRGRISKKLTPGISPLRHLYAGSLIGSGVLTFAPSLALDIAASISRDTQGAVRFDSRAFVLASARSQSGNAVGFGVSTAMSIALSMGGVRALPVILIAFGTGFVIQVLWNAYIGPDFAESQARRLLDN